MNVTLQFCKRIIQTKNSKETTIKIFRKLFSEPNNFETYCRFIFPHAFTKAFVQFHHEIIHHINKPGNGADAAPRGHGKTTLVGLGYVSHQIAYKLEKFIIYTSQNTPTITF